MNRVLYARVRARRQQEGAILFVVAMTLALLGALGVYAMSGATSEIKTSGYERQATQSHYVSEYGTIAMLDAFSPANASYFDAQMLTSPSVSQCRSAMPAGSPVTPVSQRCAKVPQEYFATAWKANGKVNGSADAFKNDSLTAASTATLVPRFTSEITEPITGGFQPGFDVNNGKCFRRYTITTFGQLSTAGETRTLSREVGRARVTAGPFDCGG
jgi:Tfp pilus assembly protein PilX